MGADYVFVWTSFNFHLNILQVLGMQVVGLRQPFASINVQGKWPSGQLTGQYSGQSWLLALFILQKQVSGPLQPLSSN
jgi:hypothetical protein